MPAQSPCNIAGKSCFRSSRDNFNKLPWPETKPTHTHTHRPTQPQTDRDRDSTATRVATAVGLWLVWRIFTRICLNYFQFSQLHGPSDLTPSLLFLPPFTQVSMLERNNGNCANLSRQSTHTHTYVHLSGCVSLGPFVLCSKLVNLLHMFAA